MDGLEGIVFPDDLIFGKIWNKSVGICGEGVKKDETLQRAAVVGHLNH